MTITEAKKLAKSMLSPERYAHTANVAALCGELAVRYGADPTRAQLAGWLHDICKEWPREALLQEAAQDAIMGRWFAGHTPAAWHGGAAAAFLRRQHAFGDEEILQAIACHTTGKSGMSLLDKILYLADAASEERQYPGAEKIRRLADKDLDAAVAQAMRCTLAHLTKQGKTVDASTLQALRDLQQ